jgi:hypothetical protein
MSIALEPVRRIELPEIEEARQRIAQTIVRTPLVRLELGCRFPDIRLKLENLQPINAYKLRGAANAVAMLLESERKRGVWTISGCVDRQGWPRADSRHRLRRKRRSDEVLRDPAFDGELVRSLFWSCATGCSEFPYRERRPS